jgi:hypothetical protein
MKPDRKLNRFGRFRMVKDGVEFSLAFRNVAEIVVMPMWLGIGVYKSPERGSTIPIHARTGASRYPSI